MTFKEKFNKAIQMTNEEIEKKLEKHLKKLDAQCRAPINVKVYPLSILESL